MQEQKNKGLSISVKSFVTALAVIFGLMVLSYILTFIIPGGVYDRIKDENGNVIIDINGKFNPTEGGLPFWKWLLSPFLVLFADGGFTIIAIVAFLLVIGGVFTCLDSSGLMKYMLDKIVNKFGKSRYKLLAVVMLFFMLMGAMVGSFEECVPLVPIVVALAVRLGWNKITGVAASLLAVGCGFASGICNPFTVGVAQQLAGLPMFSGVWLRLVSFVFIYGLLFAFVTLYAKKVERPIEDSKTEEFVSTARQDKALISFVAIVGVGIALVLSSAFITFLQDFCMIIVAVMFLVAGIVSLAVYGMSKGEFCKIFGKGALGILPAVAMILMASSIRYTLDEAKILDTILHGAIGVADILPKWVVILFIYLIVLVMNFFVASGSAKAFMLIPIIVPLAQVFGISAQLCVLAFAFGDGFSNVFYPTNAALLISLGLVDVSYTEWVKWSWKFQLANLLLTSGLLLLGLAVGY